MNWNMRWKGMSEQEACQHVAVLHFPAQCGGCTPANPITPPSLAKCLQNGVANVVLTSDAEYTSASKCRNWRVDLHPSPLAIVRPASKWEVQNSVKCAADHGVNACARAGAHGYECDAGCSGGVLIDVKDMKDFSLNDKKVWFGSGHTHGQLYYKLSKNGGLTVPGGTESDVGVSGLFLGCGRGLLTQKHGLACDSLLGVEYVDSKGAIQHANKDINSDMYWMARGGGGNFPGIVTAFHVQAYDEPKTVHKTVCRFDLATQGQAVLDMWTKIGEDTAKRHFMMSSIVLVAAPVGTVKMTNLCFDCKKMRLKWFNNRVAWMNEQVPGGASHCGQWQGDWLEKLVDEPGVEGTGDDILLYETKWPTHDRNIRLGAEVNGARHVTTWENPDLVKTLLYYLHTKPPPGEDNWELAAWIYITGNPVVENVDKKATAYGGRDSKWTVLFKHTWKPGDMPEHESNMAHHKEMSEALDQHVGCKSFYNYIDKSMTCANGRNHRWLSAYFSDPGRMKAIKRTHDPNSVFRSRLSMCGVATCTQAVLKRRPRWWSRETCGEMIARATSWRNWNERKACRHVSAIWFPERCGGCDPAAKDATFYM